MAGEEAFELSDPAVHGDLDLLRRKHYPAPVIGHEVQRGRVVR